MSVFRPVRTSRVAGSKVVSGRRSSIQKWRTTASTSARFRQGATVPGADTKESLPSKRVFQWLPSRDRPGTDSIRQVPSVGRRGRDRRSPFTNSDRTGPWARCRAETSAVQTWRPHAVSLRQPSIATAPLKTGVAPGAAVHVVGPESSGVKTSGSESRYRPP
jgi:hypothetical protein